MAIRGGIRPPKTSEQVMRNFQLSLNLCISVRCHHLGYIGQKLNVYITIICIFTIYTDLYFVVKAFNNHNSFSFVGFPCLATRK